MIALARQGHSAVGLELNYLLVLMSRINAYINGVGGATRFYKRDIWKVNKVLCYMYCINSVYVHMY